VSATASSAVKNLLILPPLSQGIVRLLMRAPFMNQIWVALSVLLCQTMPAFSRPSMSPMPTTCWGAR
jgi:hypothetical protein